MLTRLVMLTSRHKRLPGPAGMAVRTTRQNSACTCAPSHCAAALGYRLRFLCWPNSAGLRMHVNACPLLPRYAQRTELVATVVARAAS